MVKFIGEYTAKLDDKGRLVFPSQLKGQMKGQADMRFVIKKDIYAPCLQMYCYDQWEKESEEVRARLNFFKPDHAKFWREFMRERAMVEPDEKMGRISIPKALLDKIGVSKEVVFSGNDHLIEIWAKENFDQVGLSNEEYAALAQNL